MILLKVLAFLLGLFLILPTMLIFAMPDRVGKGWLCASPFGAAILLLLWWALFG